jgi:hypothetical protein
VQGDQTGRFPDGQAKGESPAHESLFSQGIDPYVRLAMAELDGSGIQAESEAIAKLSLEERYIWRLASALQSAFADFDALYVRADRKTLSDSDVARVLNLLQLHPMQFCLYLRALVGPVEMQRIMVQAINVAKTGSCRG